MFFDLDGTLWDATKAVSIAWTRVFDRVGFDVEVTKDKIGSVAGKPYLECLRIICPQAFSLESIDDLLTELKRSEMDTVGDLGGILYPGVVEGLESLASVGDLYLVSNCNGWYLDAFLDQTESRSLFKEAVCFGITGKNKTDNLLKLIHQYPLERNKYYVGDTLGDMSSAESAGFEYIHAKYGFGGEVAGSAFSFNDFESIVHYIKSIIKQRDHL
jgi:phosphoglycolate phosphatase